MANLVIFRHAESIYGSKRYAGIVDIPLSEAGILQASALSEYTKEFSPDIVYTSKLVRTTETALMMLRAMDKTVVRVGIGDLDSMINTPGFLPLIELSELNERNYGVLQNKTKDQVLEIYSSKQIQEWRRGFNGMPPEGESFCSVIERTSEFIKKYIIPYIDMHNILIVAHQNTMRAFFYLLMNKLPHEIEKIEFRNCDGIEFSIANKHVEKVNVLKDIGGNEYADLYRGAD